MNIKLRTEAGFTLIELLIAMAIVGILAAVAYASYSSAIVKSNRSSAEATLLQIAGEQEKYMMDSRGYATALSQLNVTVPASVSALYTVAVAADNTATPPTHSSTATPITGKAQENDACGTLSYNQSGTKGVSGSTVGACW